MNSFNYGISINILAKNYNCLWNIAKILNLFDETDENNKTCNYFSSWSLPLPAPSPCVHVRNWKRKPPNKHNKFWLFVAHKQMIQIDRTHFLPFPFPVAENGHKNQRKGECSIHIHMCTYRFNSGFYPAIRFMFPYSHMLHFKYNFRSIYYDSLFILFQ